MQLTSSFVAPKYAEALEIFKTIRAAEKGSQLVVKVRGETVIDLAGGVSPDSLTTVFSVSKALSALAIAKLVGDGRLDLDAKMSQYWPEFGAEGKDVFTVREVLSHRAGLTDTDPHLNGEQIHDDHAAAAALAAQRPLWAPGAGFGYHGLTIGPLMSELCYRITGKTIQQYYETEIRQPANADAFLGLPEEFEDRVTQLSMDSVMPSDEVVAKYTRPADYHSSGLAEWSRGQIGFDLLVGRAGRAFGLPSAGGVASARGLVDAMQWAVGYGSNTSGVSAEVLRDMAQMQVYGYDLALELDHRSFGTIFQKATPSLPFGSYKAFGHDGAAGALLYADPEGEIVLGYTVAKFVFPGGADREIQPIIDLVRKLAASN